MQLEEFKNWSEQFIRHVRVEKNLSDHTVRAYESDLNQFMFFWERIQEHDELPLTVRGAIERFLVALYHKKITKSSIARKVSCFRSFERYMERHAISLSLKLTRPQLDKKLPIYLTLDDITTLFNNLDTTKLPTKRPYRDIAVFELLYATGIRCAELVSLTLGAIDLSSKQLRVMGKGRKERIVLFGDKAKEAIENYIKHERPPMAGLKEQLFISQRNTPLTSRSIQRIIKMFRAFLQTNEKITPHKLRHSFATHLLTQGADLRVVQELLGHESLSSTERYTHITSQALQTMCDDLHPLNRFGKIT